MKADVISFPVCKLIDGLHWFGGRGFKTVQDVADLLSPKEQRRVQRWQTENAAWLELRVQRQRRVNQQGGGTAA